MKIILRAIISVFFLILFWPLLLHKKYLNKKVKLNKNTIIIANHYSNIDPFLIKMAFIKKRIIFVADIDVKNRPFAGFFTWLFDCVYVGENSQNLSEFKKINRILLDGGIIAIFPEGAVNPTGYGFFDFKKGVSLMAKMARANVLPLFIKPEFNLTKRSKIYIGEEITYQEYSKYKTNEEIATHFLSKVMDLGLNAE